MLMSLLNQIQLFTLVATVIAVVTVVRFQRRLKSHMTGRKAMPKLLCFKLFVLITTLQHVRTDPALIQSLFFRQKTHVFGSTISDMSRLPSSHSAS